MTRYGANGGSAAGVCDSLRRGGDLKLRRSGWIDKEVAPKERSDPKG